MVSYKHEETIFSGEPLEKAYLSSPIYTKTVIFYTSDKN